MFKLEDAPTEMCDAQLRAINVLCDVLERWATTVPGPPRRHRASTKKPYPMVPTNPKQKNTTDIGPPPTPHVQAPRLHTTMTPTDPFLRVDMVSPTVAVNRSGCDKDEPIAHCTRAIQVTPMPSKPLPLVPGPVVKRTRSQTAVQGLAHHVVVDPFQTAQQCFPREFLLDWDMPVMENVSGETLEHCKLQSHPKSKNIWNTSYSNDLGQLFQGIVKGSKGPQNQGIEVTDTFRVIRYDNIPLNRRK